MTSLPFSARVAALYRFATLEDCETLRRELTRRCSALGLKGTLLLAERINCTIAGSDHAIDAVLAFIRDIPGFADLEVKHSMAARCLSIV